MPDSPNSEKPMPSQITAPTRRLTHQEKIEAIVTMCEMRWEAGELSPEIAGTDDKNWEEFEAGLREEMRHFNAGQINSLYADMRRATNT